MDRDATIAQYIHVSKLCCTEVIGAITFNFWLMRRRVRGQYLSTQIAILVCSKLALQICKLAARLTRQECKLERSLKQACRSDEVTTRRTCSKLATSNSLQA
ncbi:hypothetical protein AVEN_52713-1 [Araneus ventricosus]|uniref:Uncharacterized protein n=1 Tax=Araneus ventricosus TaxID=182803 RepID=A0A4Y2WF35_ARAVE|nr:hypothetical protein AVEN_52713-1 [Araneus ventricosus]